MKVDVGAAYVWLSKLMLGGKFSDLSKAYASTPQVDEGEPLGKLG